MGAPGLTSPIRKETFENLQLNAGIFLAGFDYSSYADADELKTAIAAAIQDGTKLLGATRGGGSFTATRTIRTPDVDGMRYGFVGSDFVDSVEAFLSTTLIEVTRRSICACLGNATYETSGKKTTIKMHTAIQDADYIQNLCWVGDVSDGRYLLIALKNALNTADFSLTFTDKGEGTMAAEFHARQENVLDYDYAPFEIVILETSGNLGSITVTSEAGTSAVGGTKLSTTTTAASGQHFVYKIGNASTAPTIAYHNEPDYTWTEWDGTNAEINVGAANNGNKITVALLDSHDKAIASGLTTLAVKTA